jgi:hypothetical protein
MIFLFFLFNSWLGDVTLTPVRQEPFIVRINAKMIDDKGFFIAAGKV